MTRLVLLQLYQNQEKVAEHIAAEGGKDAVAKVRCFEFGPKRLPLCMHLYFEPMGIALQIKTMIESNLSSSEVSQQTAG